MLTISQAPWYWAWQPPYPDRASLFADLDPHRHSIQRRKFAAAYSMSSLVGYEPYVEGCTSLLVQRFQELSSTSQAFNLAHWLQCYAFDIIGEISFGSRFGFLDQGIDTAGIFKAIDMRSAYSTFIGIFPWLHDIIFPCLPRGGGYSYVGVFTESQVSAREKSIKQPASGNTQDGPNDFVSRFLAVHESDPSKMTRADIFTISQSNIGAGSDTTSITLSATLYYLLRNPSSMSRLVNEIDEAYASGLLIDSDPITFKQVQDLPYLQAVIKEALRLHSVTGLPLQRVVPAGGAMLAGRKFPAGSTVGINAWVAHRNEAVWGKDAAHWRPERWLEIQEQGRAGEVEKVRFAPFH